MSLLVAILLASAAGNGVPANQTTACDGGACQEKILAGMARQDLAQRLGISEKEVKTRSIRARTWPDPSLGCPKIGMMYAQVETPGYIIELTAGGKSYEYHADAKRVVTCE
jgi:hypothetical protein